MENYSTVINTNTKNYVIKNSNVIKKDLEELINSNNKVN